MAPHKTQPTRHSIQATMHHLTQKTIGHDTNTLFRLNFYSAENFMQQ